MPRIGVLSDTHIAHPSQQLPASLLRAFEGVDLIIHAGDWVDLCLLQQLEPLAKVIGVSGNMDSPGVRGEMPVTQEIEVEGVRLFVTHGWGPPAQIEQRIISKYRPRADVIVYGHTHQAVFRQDAGYYFLNPGSPTDDVYSAQRTCGILTVKQGQVEGEILPL